MICPTCRTSNAPGTLYCTRCNTLLANSQTSGLNPFEGYNPGWLPAGTAPATTTSFAPAMASAGSGLGFSLDELLKATEAVSADAAPAPTPPPVPAPPFGQSSNGAFFSAPAPNVTVPMPSFQEPPLWARPTTPPPNFNVRPEDLRNSSHSFERPPMASHGRAPEEPSYGVDRGFYFYTDEFGEIVITPLGSFLRRFGGAVIDTILVGTLVTIFYFAIGGFLISSLIDNSMEQAYRRGQTVSRRQLTDQLYQLIIGLYVMAIVISFLYHMLLVGLGGQTVGHRITKIKVIKAGGRSPGIYSSFIRALYGTIPGAIGFALSLLVNPPIIGDLIALVLNILVVIGLIWPLFDRGKQGWHDKLAKTYVVSTQKE